MCPVKKVYEHFAHRTEQSNSIGNPTVGQDIRLDKSQLGTNDLHAGSSSNRGRPKFVGSESVKGQVLLEKLTGRHETDDVVGLGKAYPIHGVLNCRAVVGSCKVGGITSLNNTGNQRWVGLYKSNDIGDARIGVTQEDLQLRHDLYSRGKVFHEIDDLFKWNRWRHQL